MRTVVLSLILALLVFVVGLGVLGFARQRTVLDRIHALTFVTVLAGPLLVLAALTGAGLSTDVMKVVLLAAAALLNGAVLSHATGRALWQREQDHTQ